MAFTDLPPQAAWEHHGARRGFETLFVESSPTGVVLRGATTALQDGTGWSVSYAIELDAGWRTTRFEASTRTAAGDRTLTARRLGEHWEVDGRSRPDLDGLVDVDFESSAVTNALPVHRLSPPEGVVTPAPAVFVRADDLRVEVIEQTYERLGRSDRFAYTSATFDFGCELAYDPSGLVLDYPGLATRVL